jgi:hypothetical protein
MVLDLHLAKEVVEALAGLFGERALAHAKVRDPIEAEVAKSGRQLAPPGEQPLRQEESGAQWPNR